MKKYLHRCRRYQQKLRLRFSPALNGYRKQKNTLFSNCLSHPETLNRFSTFYFHLHQPESIHLGDQLFYLPLVKQLAQLLKTQRRPHQNILLYPTPALQFYFQDFAPCRSASLLSHLPPATLVISSLELFPTLVKPGVKKNANYPAFFFINQTARKISAPIAQFIQQQFWDYFKLPPLPPSAFPLTLPTPRLNLLAPPPPLLCLLRSPSNQKPWFVFNNYVASGAFRLSQCRRRLLHTRVERDKKKTGALVLHLGTAADKEKDSKMYPWVDVDLRGKLSLQQLCWLFAQPQLQRTYSHDTFIMHLSHLFQKKIFVVFKRYFLPGENQQKRSVFANMLSTDHQNFTFLD